MINMERPLGGKPRVIKLTKRFIKLSNTTAVRQGVGRDVRALTARNHPEGWVLLKTVGPYFAQVKPWARISPKPIPGWNWSHLV